jgi:hypothetical protein
MTVVHQYTKLGLSKTAYTAGATLASSFNNESNILEIPRVRMFRPFTVPRSYMMVQRWGAKVKTPVASPSDPVPFEFTVNYNKADVDALRTYWSSGLERPFKLCLSNAPFASMTTSAFTGDAYLFLGIPNRFSVGLSLSDATTLDLSILITRYDI